jgi:hypothetical protein
MSFRFSGEHVVQYHTQGYAIFRDIIPATLLRDLRREADKGRPLARREGGGNAQRLQPIVRHAEIDMQPFDELDRLPVLQDALDRLFEQVPGMKPELTTAREHLGILYEPGESPYCMGWHRDFRDLWPGIDLDRWRSLLHDLRMFNQTNVALYDDGCLWAVPGSHLRADTAEEIRRFPERPIAYPDVTALDAATAEQVCREYVRSMPGAVQIPLDAGDFMLYRNTLWHIGNYVPYIRRATLHGALLTPEYEAFLREEFLPLLQPGTPPQRFRNLNADTPTYRALAPRLALQRWLRNVRRLPSWLVPRVKRRLGL